jgi:hypothetical protein
VSRLAGVAATLGALTLGGCALVSDLGYQLESDGSGAASSAVATGSTGASSSAAATPASSGPGGGDGTGGSATGGGAGEGGAMASTGVGGLECPEGFEDCNGEPGDACEVELAADGAHCGRCGHDCGGDPCVAAVCATVSLLDVSDARQIAVDEDEVFFLTYAGETLSRMAKEGGGAVTPIGDAVREPTGLSLDVEHAYVAAYSAGGGAGVRRVPKIGGDAEPIDGCNTAVNLAIDDDFVFYVSAVCGSGFKLFRRSKGDFEDVLELDDPYAAGFAYASYAWVDTTADEVYWASGTAIHRATKELDEAIEVHVADPGTIWGMARGTDGVFAGIGGDLVKILDAGGEPVVVAEGTFVTYPAALAVDGDRIVWASDTDGTVRTWPDAGGAIQILATGQQKPVDLAVDATHVYWADIGASAILRVRKPAE